MAEIKVNNISDHRPKYRDELATHSAADLEFATVLFCFVTAIVSASLGGICVEQFRCAFPQRSPARIGADQRRLRTTITAVFRRSSCMQLTLAVGHQNALCVLGEMPGALHSDKIWREQRSRTLARRDRVDRLSVPW